jgi:hypothetical protein
LASDTQFCCCQPIGDGAVGQVKDEFRAQVALLKSYLSGPSPLNLNVDYAVIASEAKRNEDDSFNWDSLTADSRHALSVAVEYHRRRQKWAVDTGQPLPTFLRRFQSLGKRYASLQS